MYSTLEKCSQNILKIQGIRHIAFQSSCLNKKKENKDFQLKACTSSKTVELGDSLIARLEFLTVLFFFFYNKIICYWTNDFPCSFFSVWPLAIRESTLRRIARSIMQSPGLSKNIYRLLPASCFYSKVHRKFLAEGNFWTVSRIR